MNSTEISERTLQRAAVLGATGCMKKSRDNGKLAHIISKTLNIPSVRILQQNKGERESSAK